MLATSTPPAVDAGNRMSVLAVLRERTRAVHVALEQSLEIARPDAGREAYARYVVALLGWMRPIEARLWQPALWAPQLNAPARALKSQWLGIDIDAARAGNADLAPVAENASVPACRSSAGRFGQAYVIEGSMLGGAFLLRRLGPRLHPWPARYLHGYGADGARYWRDFLAALAASVQTPADIADAAHSAYTTFASVAHWLRAHGAAA